MNNRGNISAKLWLVQNFSEVKEADKLVGELFSGTAGYHLNRMLDEAGLSTGDIFYCVNSDLQQTIDLLTLYRPVIILLCGKEAVKDFCPKVASIKKPFEVSLDKQVGSLLKSSLLNYDHYCIPIWPVEQIYLDWSYRDIYINLDLGKAKDELDYFKRFGKLNPLKQCNFLVEPTFAELKDYFFDKLFKTKVPIACDIETIGHRLRSNKKSKFYGHPGYYYVQGFATSITEAVSYSVWDYSKEELCLLWRWMDSLLASVNLIGQNFFNFDLVWLEAVGFRPQYNKIHDTYIRQHLLWPELPRSLQFMVKQYTRTPFFKDEGKTWSPKQKKTYMTYNCMDCVSTYEIYLAQEKEFEERVHIR